MADNPSKFRQEFKRYKQKRPPPDFTEVIDYENQDSWRGRVREFSIPLADVNKQDLVKFGLKCLDTWKYYELQGYQGFKVITNPFTDAGQLRWILKCLDVYPCKPNVCNLDAHMERNNDGNLWKLYEEHLSNKALGSSQQNSKKNQTLLDQLRWVTFGYHYNWNSKIYEGINRDPNFTTITPDEDTRLECQNVASWTIYSKDNFTNFPSELENLIKFIAKVMRYPNFLPEAAIINYYHMDSTLSAHTDHSELDLTAPLFSMSFGQACIFLLGSETLDDVPSAMFLRSGDIVIMSDETRLAYHAVPRILPDKNLPISTNPTLDEQCNIEALENYLSYSRININIRQVEGPEGRFPKENS